MDFRSHRCLQIGKSICFIDVSYFYSYSFEFLTCMRKRQAKRWKKGEAVFFCCSRSGWRKPILRGCLWTAGAAGTFSCNSTAAPGGGPSHVFKSGTGPPSPALEGAPPAKGPHRVAGDTHPQMRPWLSAGKTAAGRFGIRTPPAPPAKTAKREGGPPLTPPVLAPKQKSRP